MIKLTKMNANERAGQDLTKEAEPEVAKASSGFGQNMAMGANLMEAPEPEQRDYIKEASKVVERNVEIYGPEGEVGDPASVTEWIELSRDVASVICKSLDNGDSTAEDYNQLCNYYMVVSEMLNRCYAYIYRVLSMMIVLNNDIQAHIKESIDFKYVIPKISSTDYVETAIDLSISDEPLQEVLQMLQDFRGECLAALQIISEARDEVIRGRQDPKEDEEVFNPNKWDWVEE